MNKKERVEYILAELARGRTLQAIGNDLGLTRERVRQIASEFGFRRGSGQWPKRKVPDAVSS